MKITVKITSKNNNVQEIKIEKDQSLSFGRSSKANVKIDDGKVSGKHCILSLSNGRLEVTDADSKNGTFLNGIPVEQAAIFLGDEIRIGDSIITIEERSADKEASQLLTFAGEKEESEDKELESLRLDFTGARIQNQKELREGPTYSHTYRDREVELRRKIKSKIKLSKKEIRRRNKEKSFYAAVADCALLLVILAIPFFILKYTVPPEMKNSTRLAYYFIIEVMAVSVYYLKNFKFARYTFGERLCGIMDLHEKQ